MQVAVIPWLCLGAVATLLVLAVPVVGVLTLAAGLGVAIKTK